MFSNLLQKYRIWIHAKSQHKKIFIKGTLLNAFYKSKTIFKNNKATVINFIIL